jgi:hypothetical protein
VGFTLITEIKGDHRGEGGGGVLLPAVVSSVVILCKKNGKGCMNEIFQKVATLQYVKNYYRVSSKTGN